MSVQKTLALLGALTALALTAGALATAGAGARQPAVTIRIEGKNRTLLAKTVVHTHSGSITKGGAAKGACPASSAQGALDVATKHHWSGKWYSSYKEYEIFTVLGDHESGTKYFWEIFVNNVAATAGACEIKLHPGDQLLFAAVPVKGAGFPLAIVAPVQTTAQRPVTITVVYFDAKGKPRPLSGATVTVGGKRAKTGGGGRLTLTPQAPGKYILRASDQGYVRAEPVPLDVL